MNDLIGVIPIVVIAGASMYFFRPRGRKYQSMSDMRKYLKVGDRVITFDGICGSVAEILHNGNIMIQVEEAAKFECTRNGVRRRIDERFSN